MNYDPNLTNSGKMAVQRVRLTFAQWEYRKTIEVDVGGNCTGLSVIDCAVEKAYDLLPVTDNRFQTRSIVLMHPEKDEQLTCEDDEELWVDWLYDMLIAAEIISITPA